MRWPRILSRSWIATTLLALAGAAVCVRLGIWQLDRLAQRQAFNSHVLRDAGATNAGTAVDGGPSGSGVSPGTGSRDI